MLPMFRVSTSSRHTRGTTTLRLVVTASVVVAIVMMTANVASANSIHWDDEAFLAFSLSQRGISTDPTTTVATMRGLQMTFPNYTSPPLPDAIEVTPDPFKNDTVVDEARAAAKTGTCNETDHQCMIPFVPPSDVFPNASETPTLGVILYGGALVDPRAYSVLARRIADRYGIVVVIPIFASDISFIPCTTGRVPVAASMYPTVEKWILMGHSFGGTAAVSDLYTILTANGTDAEAEKNAVGGLVLLASYAAPIQGCGSNDFSSTDLPMAVLLGSNDGIVNRTNWKEGVANLPPNTTFFMEILGGNHGGFGSYNASERVAVLGPTQVDGPLLIDPSVQWDLSVASVAHVASRTGVPLPQPVVGASPSPSPDPTSAGGLGYPAPMNNSWGVLVALALIALIKAL